MPELPSFPRTRPRRPSLPPGFFVPIPRSRMVRLVRVLICLQVVEIGVVLSMAIR